MIYYSTQSVLDLWRGLEVNDIINQGNDIKLLFRSVRSLCQGPLWMKGLWAFYGRHIWFRISHLLLLQYNYFRKINKRKALLRHGSWRGPQTSSEYLKHFLKSVLDRSFLRGHKNIFMVFRSQCYLEFVNKMAATSYFLQRPLYRMIWAFYDACGRSNVGNSRFYRTVLRAFYCVLKAGQR